MSFRTSCPHYSFRSSPTTEVDAPVRWFPVPDSPLRNGDEAAAAGGGGGSGDAAGAAAVVHYTAGRRRTPQQRRRFGDFTLPCSYPEDRVCGGDAADEDGAGEGESEDEEEEDEEDEASCGGGGGGGSGGGGAPAVLTESIVLQLDDKVSESSGSPLRPRLGAVAVGEGERTLPPPPPPQQKSLLCDYHLHGPSLTAAALEVQNILTRNGRAPSPRPLAAGGGGGNDGTREQKKNQKAHKRKDCGVGGGGGGGSSRAQRHRSRSTPPAAPPTLRPGAGLAAEIRAVAQLICATTDAPLPFQAPGAGADSAFFAGAGVGSDRGPAVPQGLVWHGFSLDHVGLRWLAPPALTLQQRQRQQHHRPRRFRAAPPPVSLTLATLSDDTLCRARRETLLSQHNGWRPEAAARLVLLNSPRSALTLLRHGVGVRDVQAPCRADAARALFPADAAVRRRRLRAMEARRRALRVRLRAEYEALCAQHSRESVCAAFEACWNGGRRRTAGGMEWWRASSPSSTTSSTTSASLCDSSPPPSTPSSPSSPLSSSTKAAAAARAAAAAALAATSPHTRRLRGALEHRAAEHAARVARGAAAAAAAARGAAERGRAARAAAAAAAEAKAERRQAWLERRSRGHNKAVLARAVLLARGTAVAGAAAEHAEACERQGRAAAAGHAAEVRGAARLRRRLEKAARAAEVAAAAASVGGGGSRPPHQVTSSSSEGRQFMRVLPCEGARGR